MILNYYALLNVAFNASTADIKRSYRRLARLHHPDLNEQSQDELMKRLNEAYAVLSDSRKRAVYDREYRQQRKEAQEARRERERAQREQELARERAQREQELVQERAQKEPKMTWMQGMFGFVRELKKGLREE